MGNWKNAIGKERERFFCNGVLLFILIFSQDFQYFNGQGNSFKIFIYGKMLIGSMIVRICVAPADLYGRKAKDIGP